MKAGKPWISGKGSNKKIHVYVYSSKPTPRHGRGSWKIKLTNSKADWDTSWIGKANGR